MKDRHVSPRTGIRRILVGLAIALSVLAQPHGGNVHAQELCVIDFNSGASVTPQLAAVGFALSFSQCAVAVVPDVSPPDPRLSLLNLYGHYHIFPEDSSIVFCTAGTPPSVAFGRPARPVMPGESPPPCQAPPEPPGEPPKHVDLATLPRYITSHEVDQAIQLTYDGNGDGVPDPFDVKSIDVLRGPINVGVMFESRDIGVYNNLTAGVRWNLLQGERVLRVTLEGIDKVFSVDNIAIVPLGPIGPPSLTCGGLPVTIQGTPGNDTLTGTADRDVIYGLGGNDTIDALRGDDVICGGDGNDTLRGGPGQDQLFGEAEADRLEGDDNADLLVGGFDADTLIGGLGRDQCIGGPHRRTMGDSALECETIIQVP